MKVRIFQEGYEQQGRDWEREIEEELAEMCKVEAMTEEEALTYYGKEKEVDLQFIRENIKFYEDCLDRITFDEYDDDHEWYDEDNYEWDEFGHKYRCPCIKTRSVRV